MGWEVDSYYNFIIYMKVILMKKITLMALFIMLISTFMSGCKSSTNENILDAAKLDPKHYKVEFENELR